MLIFLLFVSSFYIIKPLYFEWNICLCVFYIVPNISPHDVRISRSSSTTASVLWKKLTIVEARGFITNYTISYQPLSMKREVQTFNKVEKGNKENSLLMGLEENSKYLLRIAASTNEGVGKYSNPIRVPRYTSCK